MLTHKLLRNLFRRGLRPINPQVKSLGREQAPTKPLNLRLCMAHAFAQIVPVDGSSAISYLKTKKDMNVIVHVFFVFKLMTGIGPVTSALPRRRSTD